MFEDIEKTFQHMQFGRKQQQSFLEDLCLLIEDGISVRESIDLIQSTTAGPARMVAHQIADAISKGKSVAQGMEGWFSRTCVEMIRVGETSGTLAKTLRAAIASFSVQTDALRSLISTMTYPLIVVCVAAMVSVFIKHSVLDTFSQLKPVHTWPAQGQLLFHVATFIESWWWLVCFFILGALVGLRVLLQRSTGTFRLWLDRMPIISTYRETVAAHLMENLGMLLNNGMLIKEALKVLQRDATPYLQWHLLLMEYRLSGGKENIADVLDTNLLADDDMIRLRVIAKGKSFSYALHSLGQKAKIRCAQTITLMGRIAGVLFLLFGATMAVMMVFGIYTVGSVVAT